MKQKLELYKLCEGIRRRLNYSSMSINWYVSDKHIYYGFCGALDSFQDALLAESEYEQIFDKCGGRVSSVYGFLQALYVQQDAVRVLADSVNLDWTASKCAELETVRAMRNRLVGHPSKAGNKRQDKSWAMINSSDIYRDRFSMILYWYDKPSERVEIVIDDFRRDNYQALASALRDIVKKMDQIENEYRAKYRETALEELIPKNLSYLFQKIPGDREDAPDTIAIAHLNILTESLPKMQEYLISVLGRNDSKWRFERIEAATRHLIGLLEESDVNDERFQVCDVLSKGLEEYYKGLIGTIEDLYDEVQTDPTL